MSSVFTTVETIGIGTDGSIPSGAFYLCEDEPEAEEAPAEEGKPEEAGSRLRPHLERRDVWLILPTAKHPYGGDSRLGALCPASENYRGMNEALKLGRSSPLTPRKPHRGSTGPVDNLQESLWITFSSRLFSHLSAHCTKRREAFSLVISIDISKHSESGSLSWDRP